jgi:hypothetical protein
MNKGIERSLARKIIRKVGKEFRSRGFLHSKPTFLVRSFDHFAWFIHFHKFSFGPQFRAHFGVRIMNDPFDAVALNGPSIERAGRYEIDEEETMKCTQQLISLIEGDGLTWFSSLSNTDELMRSSRSPLQDRDRQALLEDLGGRKSDLNWRISERLLGLAKKRRS